jgi:DNA-binding transcriptional LysR family regulator
MSDVVRNLDIAVLRTLLAVGELGSFARAASRVARSESAVSLQLKRLEEQIGSPLFHKVGRKMALTDAGEAVFVYARRLVELNDETFSALAGASIEGVVRLGVPQDFAETWLPAALVRFARAHPAIRVETSIDRSPMLARRLERNELDVAMAFAASQSKRALWSSVVPMRWIGPQNFTRPHAADPLALAVFDPPCFFRSAASAALDGAGMSWSIAFTSPNLAGLWAAVSGGLGVTVRTPVGLPSQLRTLGPEAGLPELPVVTLTIDERGDGARTAAMSRLSDVLVGTLEATLDAAF